MEPDNTPTPSIVNFLVFISGNASADTRALYPAQYPVNFLRVNATTVPVFRTRYGRSAFFRELPSLTFGRSCGVVVPCRRLGVARRFPGRHPAFRHGHVGFADGTVDFAGACGRFESIREQISLQCDAVGPHAFECGDVLDL